jgi:hypothetical protein
LVFLVELSRVAHLHLPRAKTIALWCFVLIIK